MTEKIVISYEIPIVAVGLYPRIITELNEILRGFFNAKKLRFLESEPGRFLVHGDQPELKRRMDELKEQLRQLENIGQSIGKIEGYDIDIKQKLTQAEESAKQATDKMAGLEAENRKIAKELAEIKKAREIAIANANAKANDKAVLQK